MWRKALSRLRQPLVAPKMALTLDKAKNKPASVSKDDQTRERKCFSLQEQ